MNFTEMQKRAIDERNASLLVAAGAGSGKTRVLTERILSRLLDTSHPTDITRFLAVTFTNAAGAELKDRIRTVLTDASGKYPQNAAIVRNMALLNHASVCTIDSFCLDLVKEHAEELGLSPKCRIADENETNVLLNDIINEVIEEKLSSEDAGFLLMFDLLSSVKSDDAFDVFVRKFYRDDVSGAVSADAYFEAVKKPYRDVVTQKSVYASDFGIAWKTCFDETVAAVIAEYRIAEKVCLADEQIKKAYYDTISAELAQLVELQTASHTSYRHDGEWLSRISFRPRIGTLKGDFPEKTTAQKARDEGKALLKKLRDECYAFSEETLISCAEDTLDVLDALHDFISLIDGRFANEKKRRALLEFSDVTHYALHLLYDEKADAYTPLAARIAEKYDEIYIDEYQDVNPMQDRIFHAIAKKDEGGEEINRFLVGDIKQSIYRFRGAEPEIFAHYRAVFDDVDADSRRKKIFMQHNFRCEKSVIDYTNHVFSRLMGDEYLAGDALIFAKTPCFDKSPQVKMVFADSSNVADGDDVDEKEVTEYYLFDTVRSLVNNPAYTDVNGKMYGYNDIAILTPTRNEAKRAEKYLSSHGIPVTCETGENLFDTREIRLAMDILRAVDNPLRDIPLADFLLNASPSFSDDELAQIRLRKKDGSLFAALTAYSENDALKQKIGEFLDGLRRLQRDAGCVSCSAFLEEVYEKTALMAYGTSEACGQREKADVRRKNLQKLMTIAANYDKTAFHGLAEFLQYADTLRAGDNVTSCNLSGEQRVRIMTIHKSKGLEFSVCILFSTAHQSRPRSSPLEKSKKLGVAMNFKNLAAVRCLAGDSGRAFTKNTPFRYFVMRSEKKPELEEMKRSLYVAVTRAKERLIIMGIVPTEKDAPLRLGVFAHRMLNAPKSRQELLLYGISDTQVYGDWVYALTGLRAENAHEDAPYLTMENYDVAEVYRKLRQETEVAAEAYVYAPDADMVRAMQAALGKAKDYVAIPPKLTVSLLKNGLIDYDNAVFPSDFERKLLTAPTFVSSDKPIYTASDRGTAMHTFLQFADFENAEKYGAEREAKRLCDCEFLEDFQRDLLDIRKLNAFFATPLYENIRGASAVYREKRFNLKVDAAEVIRHIPENTDEFVLVQGVIDLFYEVAPDVYHIVDFKTDRVTDEEAFCKKYIEQLRYYTRAVKEITLGRVERVSLFSFDKMKEYVLDVE